MPLLAQALYPASTAMRRRFSAMHTSFHSARTRAVLAWPDDYERRICQTIMSRAILKTMAMAGRQEVACTLRSVLILQSRLPEKYRQLAMGLSVEVIEGVGVKSDAG